MAAVMPALIASVSTWAQGTCAVYLRTHCFPLLSPSRQYHAWDSTSNRLATLAGDHASPFLETSLRPLMPNQTAG